MTPEQKLSNDEIARVFAMYSNSNVIVPKEYWVDEWMQNKYPDDLILPIRAIDFVYAGVQLNSDDDPEFSFEVNDIKLLLTPLEKISDEHAGKLEKMEDTDYGEFMNRSIESDRFQQLIIWGYAVPLFFGIDHWANSKTAIELGIAIDKTQL
jgi:hypothetical protein